MKSWELENVVKTSLENKDAFFIPSENERNNQKINDKVRLHFILKNPSENEPCAERMWVEIIKRTVGKITKYVGILTNQPAFIKDLKIFGEIEFNANNIAQTIIKKDDPRWIDSDEKYALVSKKYLEKDAVIRFLYRQEPDRDEDSGWRMFTGLENDEYANDPENIKIINIGYLLNKDPGLLEPLKNGYGVAFERKSKKAKWKKIEDWKPED
jgi:hypothetical protein